MRQFHFNDFNDDDEDNFEVDGIIHMSSFEPIDDLEISERLLGHAIKIASQNLFWRFYSIKKKMTTISEIYEKLESMIEGEF